MSNVSDITVTWLDGDIPRLWESEGKTHTTSVEDGILTVRVYRDPTDEEKADRDRNLSQRMRPADRVQEIEEPIQTAQHCWERKAWLSFSHVEADCAE